MIGKVAARKHPEPEACIDLILFQKRNQFSLPGLKQAHDPETIGRVERVKTDKGLF